MFEAFSTRQNRILAFVFLALCGLFGTAVAAIGVADNPPGMALAYVAVAAFIMGEESGMRTSDRAQQQRGEAPCQCDRADPIAKPLEGIVP